MRKKVLFVCHHYPDRSPGQRFRFEQYLNYLNVNGFDVEMSYLLNKKDDKVFYASGNYFNKFLIVLKSLSKRFKDIRRVQHFDVVFIFRESFFLGFTFFEKQLTKNVPSVFDFDDSIWLQNVSDANKKLVFLKNANKTSKLIGYCTKIFAGNEYLANYARQFNQNISIIPTTIDTEEYQKMEKPASEKICIGWSGSVTTIQHFEFALPFLEKIKEKYGDLIEIKVIGDADYRNEHLDIQGIGWNKADEIKELSSFDIGIMPLPDDEWAKGKCGLKGLQYMAVEVPTIMSPVGVNTEIIQDGENGFLAATKEEWLAKIELLIQDKALRLKMGKAGRQTVVEKYSVEAWKDEYLRLFTALAEQNQSK